MIHSIFQLGDTLTREIMVPRIDVIALEVDTPLPEAMDKLLQSGFSRVPVYDDTVDNVIGMLYAKDLISLWRAGKNQDESLRSILREANGLSRPLSGILAFAFAAIVLLLGLRAVYAVVIG